MSKNTVIVPDNVQIVQHSKLYRLCDKALWDDAMRYLKEYNNVPFFQLIESLRCSMSTQIYGSTLQFPCITQIAKKLKNHTVPDNLKKIAVKNNGKILDSLCKINNIQCLKSIIKIKDFFTEDSMYLILRHHMGVESFQLLVHNVDLKYLNTPKYIYNTPGYLETFSTPLLHTLLDNKKVLSIFQELIRIPGIDLHIKDSNEQTALEILEKKIKYEGNISILKAKYQSLTQAIKCSYYQNTIVTNINPNNTIINITDKDDKIIATTNNVSSAKSSIIQPLQNYSQKIVTVDTSEDDDIMDIANSLFAEEDAIQQPWNDTHNLNSVMQNVQQAASYNDNRIEDSIQNVLSFKIEYLIYYNAYDIISLLKQDIDFADRVYKAQNEKFPESVAQRIVSLMRYDLMEAIVLYIKKIPSSVFINNIIMHEWSTQLSDQHKKYQENAEKFVRLFINYGATDFSQVLKLATQQNNNVILKYLHTSYDTSTTPLETHKMKIVPSPIQYQNSTTKDLLLPKQQNTNDAYWKQTITALKDIDKISVPDLIKHLRQIMKIGFSVHSIPDHFECIAIISQKLYRQPLPENYEKITITNDNGTWKTLTAQNNIFYLKSIINIKNFFANNTLYILLRHTSSYDTFDLLINHVSMKYINKSEYIYECYGIKKCFRVPILHRVSTINEEMFKRLLKIPELNLYIQDDKGHTLLDILNKRLALGNYSFEVKKKYQTQHQELVNAINRNIACIVNGTQYTLLDAFHPADLCALSVENLILLLNLDTNFAHRLYKFDDDSLLKTVFQRIVSLMRYDLMEAIVNHTKDIQNISVHELIAHNWSHKSSLKHREYKENIGKFLKLFADYNMLDFASALELAYAQNNTLALEILRNIRDMSSQTQIAEEYDSNEIGKRKAMISKDELNTTEDIECAKKKQKVDGGQKSQEKPINLEFDDVAGSIVFENMDDFEITSFLGDADEEVI